MKAVLHSFGYSLEFLREQIADVAEETMAVQAEGVVNHPAWTVGHILFTCQMIGGVIGVEKWLPRGWGKLFGTGGIPLNSPPYKGGVALTPLLPEEGCPKGGVVGAADGVVLTASAKNKPRMNADNADQQILSLSASSAQIRGRFSPGTEQAEKVYPTKQEFLALIRETKSRITRAVEGLDEAVLDSPFPEASYLEVFPTIRHSLTQVLVGHVSFHVGQLSVWRRAMGLPPMSRSFD